MADESKGKGTSILMIIAVGIAAFVGGYFVNGGTKSATDNKAGSAKTEIVNVKGSAGDSDKIPLGNSFVMGNPDAPITIVEFSDFQCPYCSRGGATVKKIVEKYPNDVKIAFKHFPLGFHKEAPAAAKASIAAGKQGKFEEMHDKLFDTYKTFKGKGDAGMKTLVLGFAKELGLDVKKFEADFDDPKTAQIIKDDQALAGKLGVRGTPHFFINGERLSGAQPIEKFEGIVKKQIGEVKTMLAAGTAKSDIYGKMVAKNFKAAEQPKKQAPKAANIQYVPVNDNDAVKGPKDALVTIVEFSDFECPYCTRVVPTIAKINEKFGKDVRIVFKQNPLPFHKHATAASIASLAALQQGKFWEMHDLLFENQKKFKTTDMKELSTSLAAKLGLNASKFKKDFEDPKFAAQVKADLALGAKVGFR